MKSSNVTAMCYSTHILHNGHFSIKNSQKYDHMDKLQYSA